jgi:predicted naringenin-chalcone synthase
MSFGVIGLATAVPAHALSQAKAAHVARVICCQSDERAQMLTHLYEHTGIDTRHMALGEEVARDVISGRRDSGSVFLPSGAPDDLGPTTAQRMATYAALASPLATEAAQKALADARLPAASVTHLITISCTGFAAPGIDVRLIKQLGLPPTVQRTHIGFMGCHAAVNGLRVARALVDAEPTARVLLCAVELCSVHFHYQWNPKRNVAGALFADGAAAVVGAAGTQAPPDAWRVVATGSCLFPDSEYAMRWNIGDHGFDMDLSTRIPTVIAGGLRPWLEKWLAQNELHVADVRCWAVHPGGPRILGAVEEGLCLPREALADSHAVLARCGNMSSPTVLFILERLRGRRAPRPCVLLAFGPGLVAEAALLS